MIVYKTGNILDDDADWLVNPVNCVGVMGAGLAKQFKDKFGSHYFNHYKYGCKSGKLNVGRVYIYHAADYALTNKGVKNFGVSVINFPTKKHWKDSSKIEYIECGLNDLTNSKIHLYKGSIPPKSIAFPKLGCGLGGLNWDDVKPLLEDFAAKNKNIEVRIYE